MNKFFAILAAGLLASGVAVANNTEMSVDQIAAELAADEPTPQPAPAPTPGEQKPRHENPCAKVNLDEAQKAQIKAIVMKYREAKITLDAGVKLAKFNFYKLAVDPKGDVTTAQAVTQTLSDAISKSVAAKLGMRSDILFNVLKAEQREPAIRCQKMKKHHGKHGHKHGGHHGKGKGKGKGDKKGGGHAEMEVEGQDFEQDIE